MTDDLTGKKFGRLTAIALHPVKTNQGGFRYSCACDCGGSAVVSSSKLRLGRTRSCGCLIIESARNRATHRSTKTPTYRSWVSMRERCYSPRASNFKWYGRRGITVCERWKSSFETFRSDMGERPSGTTLDRLNPDGNYEPGNCRWATSGEQARSKRVTRLSVSDAAKVIELRQLGVPGKDVAAMFGVTANVVAATVMRARRKPNG